MGVASAVAVPGTEGLGAVFGLSWQDKKKGTRVAAVLLVSILATFLVGVGSPARTPRVPVIVRSIPAAASSVAEAVRDAGGTILRRIGLIDAVVASVPRDRLDSLAATPGVLGVTPDRPLRLLAQEWSPQTADGSMLSVTRITGARDLWRAGYTGDGVGVALIDSGVAPVPGLDAAGKVVNGVDYSFDAPNDDLRYLDSYGHGTHLAGIIAGRDAGVAPGREGSDVKGFLGMAPGAHIVNVKVGATNGVVDVSQVIAAIAWVVNHHDDPGMNIQVLSLSFGTDGTQDYVLDPLAFAAEQAWHAGITVVVAAGNAGFGDSRLNDPAIDPYVIAVGADDPSGTYPTNDDVVPDWSSRGDGIRNPDLVAPGVSIVSLRDPGSYVDTENPSARVGDRFFKGSGTSQATAVVSGAAALLEQQRPGITPDQVKALLTSTAAPLPEADPVAQGAGELDLRTAMRTPTPDAVQTWSAATGTGSLEASRGSVHVVGPDGSVLQGEQDVFGLSWDATRWLDGAWDAMRWTSSTWNAMRWADLAWQAMRWAAMRWTGLTWDAMRWSAMRWSAMRWAGLTWSDTAWA
jgi:serine protease AprX